MAIEFNDARFFLDEYDLSTFSKSINVESSGEQNDATAFGSIFKSSVQGLKSVSVSGELLFDPQLSDAPLDSKLKSTSSALTVCAAGGALGDNCFNFEPDIFEYGVTGNVGELFSGKFNSSSRNNSALAKGKVFLNVVNATVSSSVAAQSLPNAHAYQANLADLQVALHATNITGTAAITVFGSTSADFLLGTAFIANSNFIGESISSICSASNSPGFLASITIDSVLNSL